MVRDDRKDVSNEPSGSGNGEESGSESGDSSSSEEPVIEYLAASRSRRANAGNKMSSLIESTSQEDDFYKSAYGGFNEDEVDEVFKSPVHSDVDEVDSDFDKSEEEDEPISDQEDPDKRTRRKKTGFKEPSRGSRNELLSKNKWAVARMAGFTGVLPNTVDAKTQKERLREAEKTEVENIAYLKKYEQFELEHKKKREKTRIAVPPPYIAVRSKQGGNEIVVPDIKSFSRVPPRIPSVCAVTGRPARYKDPLTGLPYASKYAFRVIRDKYHKYLKTIKGNAEVDRFLEQFEESSSKA